MPLDDYISLTPTTWPAVLLTALVAVFATSVSAEILARVLRRGSRGHAIASALVEASERPMRSILPLLGLLWVWRAAPAEMRLVDGIEQLTVLTLVAALTWLGVRCVSAIGVAVVMLHPADVEDNLRARRVHTQTQVLVRTFSGIVGLIGVSVALMTFPAVRQIGASLLASAGVAGLIVGMAARPALANMIAGLQIALTQPIRLDDVVIIQGEWGRIEEISGTYVVVHLWDDRRLVVPLQWFIENPFQNWTRTNARITGSVFLWVDYGTPLDGLRAEALRVCKAANEWDGRACLLQVTDTSERAMQLRILVTSADASRNFDLRCKVREATLDYLRRDYPQYLPQLRVGDRAESQDAQPPPVQTKLPPAYEPVAATN